VRGQRHAPTAFYPGKDTVPIVQEAGWAPGAVWTGAKISPPPGFDPRTVQLVASRYTDWDIPAHLYYIFPVYMVVLDGNFLKAVGLEQITRK
jgi:hypothetical protein